MPCILRKDWVFRACASLAPLLASLLVSSLDRLLAASYASSLGFWTLLYATPVALRSYCVVGFCFFYFLSLRRLCKGPWIRLAAFCPSSLGSEFCWKSDDAVSCYLRCWLWVGIVATGVGPYSTSLINLLRRGQLCPFDCGARFFYCLNLTLSLWLPLFEIPFYRIMGILALLYILENDPLLMVEIIPVPVPARAPNCKDFLWLGWWLRWQII